MPLLTPPPPAPQRYNRATFSTLLDAFITWLINFVGEMAALVSGLNTLAAGGAYAIPYVIDLSSTADADPTAGKLRFNSATQNAATTIYLDLLGSDGVDYTSILDQLDASTSVTKGQLRLVKIGDATKFLTFDVAARVTATGYRKLTLTNTGGSSANPFSTNDAVVLKFTRTGDKGAVGDPGYMNLIASGTVTGSPGIIDFLSVFTSAYDTYRVEIQGLTTSISTLPAIYFANAGVMDSTTKYTSLSPSNTSPTTAVSGFNFPAQTQASASTFVLEVRNANSATSTKTLEFRGVVVGTYYVCGGYYNGANAISGFRLIVSGASFTGGTIRIYGIKNT